MVIRGDCRGREASGNNGTDNMLKKPTNKIIKKQNRSISTKLAKGKKRSGFFSQS